MSPADSLASAEGFLNDGERRKRLGQYFSGTSLGRVLAALGGVDNHMSVIDPMSGNGDLLAACMELGADPSLTAAIDIDPLALNSCKQRIPTATCIMGSAFDPATIKKLPRLKWDLVITNPPYVRYQSTSKGSGKEFPLPSSVDVRGGLISIVEMLPSLQDTDKKLFRSLIEGYSGLADLAVPSWILCAGLVAPGGRLALILPESWLSREYAAAVHYMLLRWFDIEYVVEDEHAVWFPGAQVKTTLLIAKRVKRRKTIANFPIENTFLKIAVSSKASGPQGPFSRLMQSKSAPEKQFANKAQSWLALGSRHEDEMIRAFHIPIARTASNVLGLSAKQKWFPKMGEAHKGDWAHFPHELEEWIERSPTASTPVSLSSLGVQTGQGLRTGANSFFYGTMTSEGDLEFEKLSAKAKMENIEELVLPAIRKQSDLSDSFLVTTKTSKGRVLNLQKYALPKDILSCAGFSNSPYNELPKSLSLIVQKAESANFGKNGEDKKIWELSAVAPNIRVQRGEVPPRFWYMLPEFTRRHKPDLFIARINSSHPKAYLNKNAECIVDANFITVWSNENSNWGPFSLLALLNSAWTIAALECSASVMGGGALKVEASHLKRLPVPPIKGESLSELTTLGEKLSNESQLKKVSALLERIDKLIASVALGREASSDDLQSLRDIANFSRLKRQNHRKK